MKFIWIKLLSCFIGLLLLNSTTLLMAQPGGNPDMGIVPGATKPKANKLKKPKIKYTFHDGIAYLKTGLILEGTFRYVEALKMGDVPQYDFVEKTTGKKNKVSLPMIERMILKGSEQNITAFVDSTEFVWIEKYKDLYRKVRNGELALYDNSRVVDEVYPYLTDYVLLAGRENFGYKLIRQVSDLELMMTDQPYFMASARATGRLETKDMRVVVYLVDLFNDPNPMKTLKWQPARLVLRNNEMVEGSGYLQPLDMRKEHTKTNNAYIHFHDGERFRLYTQRDLKKVEVSGKVHEKGLYQIVNKHFFGEPWAYEGTTYLITRRIINSNNYFFRSRTKAQDLVILQEVAGNYIKPLNETNLKRAYIQQLKAQLERQKAATQTSSNK
ncbi:MAG: hypothetical protein ACPGXL_05200 [Chitinophagales bacterium]